MLRKIRHLSRVELANGLHVSKQCVSTDALLGLENIKTVSVEGLTDVQIDHIKLLVEDLRGGGRS